MTRYARVIDGTLDSVGVLPPELLDASAHEREAAGYYEVLNSPEKPADTGTSTFEPSFDTATGSIVWVERDKSADELAGEAQQATQTQIRAQITDHLTELRKLAQSSGALTNTQRDQALRALARGQIRLIRLTVGLLDGTD